VAGAGEERAGPAPREPAGPAPQVPAGPGGREPAGPAPSRAVARPRASRAPRTVLYLHSSAGRYGADRQLAVIATGLDPARWRPLVVLAMDGELREDLQAAGVEVLVRPLAVLRRAAMSPAGLAGIGAMLARDAGGLARLARRRDVALIHTNTSVTLGGMAAARVARIPHVWHLREIYTGFERWWPVYRRMLLTADALPCVSQATADQLGGDPRARVLHDGLPIAPSRSPRGEARAALDLPADAFVCAILGRISTWKGQDVLIRALADPALTPGGAIGLVAGDPWQGEERRLRELRALVETLGVSERVRFCGFRSDVENVYGAADVVCVPSTRPDPLPNAALEAAAAGCCVVAARHGGLPEILRDGTTGVLVTPGDPAALAAALAQLHADPARREQLGAAAAADVRERFAAARLLERTQSLYDDVIERRTS
jgi:glycosyltransferase involved in cell wall biosynthesis